MRSVGWLSQAFPEFDNTMLVNNTMVVNCTMVIDDNKVKDCTPEKENKLIVIEDAM